MNEGEEHDEEGDTETLSVKETVPRMKDVEEHDEEGDTETLGSRADV
jgi:hypothetical protein